MHELQNKKSEDKLIKQEEKYKDLKSIIGDELLKKDKEISHLKDHSQKLLQKSRGQKIRITATKS